MINRSWPMRVTSNRTAHDSLDYFRIAGDETGAQLQIWHGRMVTGVRPDADELREMAQEMLFLADALDQPKGKRP
jgi:hypothetical protein